MPSVVERAFRPTRNALLDHYLDAYTAAIDAMVARHGGEDNDDNGGGGGGGGDGRGGQTLVLEGEADDGDREVMGSSTPGEADGAHVSSSSSSSSPPSSSFVLPRMPCSQQQPSRRNTPNPISC
jgi:hypothetical protein